MKPWSIIASLALHATLAFTLLLKSFHPMSPSKETTSPSGSLFSVKVLNPVKNTKSKSLSHSSSNTQKTQNTQTYSQIANPPPSSSILTNDPNQTTALSAESKNQKETEDGISNTSQIDRSEGLDDQGNSPVVGNEGELDSSPLGEDQHFLSQLKIKLQQNLDYPLTLRKKGIEGTVVIQFTLDEQGNALNTSVTQSSGFLELDQLALKAIEKSSPFSRQKKMGKLKLSLPIQFKITI